MIDTSSREPFDAGYPVYRGGSDPSTVSQGHLLTQAGKRVLAGWVDQLYFIVAGLASIWLAIVALFDAWNHSWYGIPLILIFWVIAAYLTLPRFHRIMTIFYVPNYFIGRTRTGDGLLGDPVNIGLRGESVDIHQAMQKAGWHKAEPVTLASSWRIIVNTLRRRPYPTAPVSPLYLFNRKEDFAYQQEVDGSPSKRHHVRFWKTPAGWKLPGGTEVDWLAAATFDRAVGLSLFTLQVTHKIDADTDKERDYVVETIQYCNPDQTKVEVIQDFSTGYHSRNGGGDNIVTDGHLPIVDVNDVVEQKMEIADTHQDSKYSHHRSPWELAEDAPLSVWIAAACVGLLAVLQLVLGLLNSGEYQSSFAEVGTDAGIPGTDFLNEYVGFIALGLLVLLALIQVGLAAMVVRGRRRARKLLLALLMTSFIINAVTVLQGQAEFGTVYSVYVLMGIHVFALIEFTDDDAVNYTHNATESRRANKAARIKAEAKS